MSQSNLTLPTRTEAEARAQRAQHTPGQWHLLPHNPRIVMGGDNHPVARTDVACRIRKGSDEYALCAANARLITAAPELLAALKACASRLALHAVHGNMDVIDAARAAIAKAEGL